MPKSDAWLGLWRSLKLTTKIRKIKKKRGKKNDVASARRKKSNIATSTETSTTPKTLILTMNMTMRTLSGLIMSVKMTLACDGGTAGAPVETSPKTFVLK